MLFVSFLQHSFHDPKDQSDDGNKAVGHPTFFFFFKKKKIALVSFASFNCSSELFSCITGDIDGVSVSVFCNQILKLPVLHAHPQFPAESGDVSD